MKPLKDRVKVEIKRRMKMYIGKEWIPIHRETAKHIIKALKETKDGKK